jgi:putative Mn2+ efflux pump MntP
MYLVWQLLVLGIAMGFNNALASVALGAMNMSRRHQLRTAMFFAVFEALMPVLGLIIGEEVAVLIGGKAKYIGVFILVGVGIYALLKKDVEDERGKKHATVVQTLMLGVALSLDNLTVGFGLGMFDIPVGFAAAVFGLVSLCMTLIGLEAGRLLGNRFTISADKLSGIVLLATAGLMLIH